MVGFVPSVPTGVTHAEGARSYGSHAEGARSYGTPRLR